MSCLLHSFCLWPIDVTANTATSVYDDSGTTNLYSIKYEPFISYYGGLQYDLEGI